ncbi:putative phosphatidylethanolamine methyltransferase [Rosellinia necatrix]|uniref:Putative phosphatidylethanolamine methyltransferase n=1 Tax=Rosellinia necatrix TaxID=77044 RepID=A0A1W2TNV8_ROSNE|nr:putative phosphatidylethanolamine methyltransferase [Rosellinia necatrix]
MSSTVSDSGSDAGPVIVPPTTSTTNADIDITAQPAVLTWRTSDGENKCLSHLNLDLHYHVRSNKAFFKLRAAVALKSHPRSRTTAVFLIVHPERIRALVLDDSPCAPEAKTLGPETVCLHFELSRLPALVVPKESLAPRNQASGNLLDSLREAVRQGTFSVYAKIPCRRLPRQRLLALCGAASRNELRSIAAHSNISSLYSGAGGECIEGDSLSLPDSTTLSAVNESTTEPLMENPPSYDEVGSGPPPIVPNPHKRRRLSVPGPEPASLERLDRKYIEDICTHIIDNRLGQIRRDMAKELQDLENRVIGYVDEQLILQRQETTEDLGHQTEDEYYGLKLDLQNYVREEIEEAEGRILDHLGTASFSLQLNP